MVWAANPGMRGGRAIAELLLGQIEPTGRLPISFARHVGQQPTYYNQIRGQHGDRYADLTQEPAVRVRRGAVVHDRRVRGAAVLDRRVGAATTPCAPQVTVTNTGDPAGAGDRAGLRPRLGHLGQLGRQGAQGVPPGRPRPGRVGAVAPRTAGRGLHDRRRRRAAGSSSRASSSCWSAPPRGPRTCCGPGSPSSSSAPRTGSTESAHPIGSGPALASAGPSVRSHPQARCWPLSACRDLLRGALSGGRESQPFDRRQRARNLVASRHGRREGREWPPG